MNKINPIEPLKPTFLARIENEYEAFYFYRTAGSWCAIHGFKNAARYFDNEANAESAHATRLQEFMQEWGVSFEMPVIDAAIAFESLPDIICRAYEMEAALYKAYNEAAREAFPIDISAFALFMDYVAIQQHSVAEYMTMLDQLEHTDANGTGITLFEEEAFGEPAIV